jgi:hypothetical protein
MAAMVALDPVGEQLEYTSHMQITNQMTATTVPSPQTFPFEVAHAFLPGGPILRVKLGETEP